MTDHVWREVVLDEGDDDPELICAGCGLRAYYGAEPTEPCPTPENAEKEP